MATIQSYGILSKVRDIAAGKIFYLPTSKGTALAMMIGLEHQPEQKHIAWLTDSPYPGENRFDLIDIAHHQNNTAIVINDVAFLPSTDPLHLIAYEGRIGSGPIVEHGKSSTIHLGNGQNLRASVDIVTGLRGQNPIEDGSCLAFTAWSLVRYENNGGQMKSYPLCEWKLRPTLG
jgi:hypothetical protein